MISLYHKKKKIGKKLGIGIGLVLCFILLFFSYTRNSSYLKIEKIIHDIGIFLEGVFISEQGELEEEIIDGIHQELELENQELKKLLELNYSNYQKINATVIKRDINWFHSLIINKGERQGIGINMAVVSSQGLIGKVIQTNENSSVVELLSSGSNRLKVSVSIAMEQETVHGILNGYLEQESLLEVNYIPKEKKIEIGSSVYTSGLGEVYPAGIYVGKIEAITLDSLGLYQIAKIRPDTSYDTIRYVSIFVRENL